MNMEPAGGDPGGFYSWWGGAKLKLEALNLKREPSKLKQEPLNLKEEASNLKQELPKRKKAGLTSVKQEFKIQTKVITLKEVLP